MGFLSILKRLFESDRVDLATHFEMLREAVSGTMSSFHKARDLETGKIVGLKILDPLKVDPIENRYKGLSKPSEGEIGSRITGPHVARTIRSGIATTQRAFIVFEFIDGTDLHSVLSSGTQLPPQTSRSCETGRDGNRICAQCGLCAQGYLSSKFYSGT